MGEGGRRQKSLSDTHRTSLCPRGCNISSVTQSCPRVYKVVYSKGKEKIRCPASGLQFEMKSVCLCLSLFLAGDCDDISVLCLESEDDVRLVVLLKLLLLPKECIWAFSHELHIQLVDIKNHHYKCDTLAGGNFCHKCNKRNLTV